MEEKKSKLKRGIFIFLTGLIVILIVFILFGYFNYKQGLSKENLLTYNVGNRTLDSLTGEEVSNAINNNSTFHDLKGLANPRLKIRNSTNWEMIGLDHSGSITMLGNMTDNDTATVGGGYGFFAYLGDSTNRVLKGWFTNLDVKQNINSTNVTTNAVIVQGVDIDDTYLQWGQATNGTLLTTETDPKWSANYSTFLTHIDWSKVLNGTLWTTNMNGTLMSQATFNTNYSTLTPWSAVMNNTLAQWSQVMNGTVTSGFYNVGNAPIYLNDTFRGNYSNFSGVYGYALNASTFTYANALNGTLFTQAEFDTNYTNFRPLINLTWFTTNYTANDALYRSFANNYSNFSVIYGYAINDTIGITWANALNGTLFTQSEYDTNYTANDALYRSFSANYSTYLTHRPWSDSLNGTLMSQATYNTNYSTLTPWSSVMNGTVMSQATFNTNYSTNDALYRSFSNNYSTFLTHATWANVINGTALLTATFNTNYTTNDPVYRSWSANYSNFSVGWGYATNSTLAWSTAMNNTLAQWSQVMNGTVTSGFYNVGNAPIYLNDTFRGNYSNFSIIYGYAINDTIGITWANAVNGTLFTQSEFDTNYTNFRPLINLSWFTTNYTTNDPVYRSFSNNYSNFSAIYGYALNATGITWAQATNGTLLPYTGAIKNIDFGIYNVTMGNQLTVGANEGIFNLWADSDAWLFRTNGVNNNLEFRETTIGSIPRITFISGGSLNVTGSIFSQGNNLSTGYNYALNSTGTMTWANAVNGTLFTQAEFDTNYTNFRPLINLTWFTTNYTANDANYRSFSANYSTYLTHIPWSTAMNNTLAQWSQVMNNTLVQTSQAYNGTLAKIGSINVWAANQTIGTQYITNGTGGAYVQNNGTTWIIQGATSRFELW